MKNNSNINLTEEESKKIQEKLSELNRTSLNRKLIELFKYYEIPFEKGLDEKGHFKFLEFRDKYIHSTRDYDGDALFDEYERLKKYFELIVLKLLDKNSLSHLHRDFKSKWERTL